MRVKDFVKRNSFKRILAMVLLVCCVLPMLPADIFAAWRITPTETEEAIKGGGEGKLTFRYFANDLYVPASGNYQYYTVDAYNNGGEPFYEGAELSVENNAAAVKEKILAAVSSGAIADPILTAPLSGTVTATSGDYCTQSNYDCANLPSSAADAAPGFGSTTLSAQGSVTVSGTQHLLSMGTISGSATFQGTSGAPTNIETSKALIVSSGVTLDAESGVMLYAIPDSTTDATASNGTAVEKNTSNAKHQYGSFIVSLTHYAKVQNYSCTLSYTLSYYAYVVVPPENPTTTGGSYEIDGASYELSNLAGVGAQVGAPTLTDLTSKLSNTVKPYLKYVEGFYTGVAVTSEVENAGTDEEKTKNKIDITNATRVTFPYTLQTETADEIWVNFIPNNPGDFAIAGQDLNADISKGSVSIVGVDPSTPLPTDPDLNLTTKTIQNDKAYYSITKNNADGTTTTEHFFSLYSNIAAGTTVDFCMNDGNTNINAAKDDSPTKEANLYGQGTVTDTTAALDASNPRDYTVVLQNNIEVSGGIIYLGGYTGVYSNSTEKPQGYIVKNYVALDLNGHDLVLKKGAVLHSYGYIYDSVGTGKIIVEPGATLYTQILIYGMNGLSTTLKLFDMGYCPFDDYNFPYLNVTVDVMTDETGAGTLYGYSMVYPSSSLGVIFNYYMKLFAAQPKTTDADTSAPLFEIEPRFSTEDGYVRLTATEVELLSNDATVVSQCMNVKNVFTFNNLNVAFTAPTLRFVIKLLVEQTVALDMRRIIFPISPMVDLTCNNSVFTLSQQIIVMPGSTLTFDQNSVVRLSTEGAINFGKIDVPIGGTGVAAKTKTPTGGLFAPSYCIQTSQTFAGTPYRNGLGTGGKYGKFWDYFKSATVNIYGVLEFETGNTVPYVLSGNINVSSFRTCGADGVSPTETYLWRLENLKQGNLGNVQLNTYGMYTATAISTSVSTSNEHSAKIKHYYCLPLISNGDAFLFSTNDYEAGNEESNPAKVGTYDVNTGVFTEHDSGSTYVILPTTITFPADTKTGEMEFDLEIVQTTVTNEQVTYNSQAYVYYCGAYIKATAVTDATTGAVTGYSIDVKTTFNGSATAAQTVVWSTTNQRWE